MFFLELLVEVAVVVLEEALADPQLPNFLVSCDGFDRMFALRETKLKICAAQRVLELGGANVSVSVCVQRRNNKPDRVPLGSTGRARTHIFDLVATVYLCVHGDGHGGSTAERCADVVGLVRCAGGATRSTW